MVVGICGIGLLMLGCARGESQRLPGIGSSEPAPEGAVYRSFYRGGVAGYEASRVRWLDDGDGFELTLTGSGNCPVVPVAIEVLAPDRLLIETKQQVDPGGCQEDSALWSFVLDAPGGLDSTAPVQVDISGEGIASTEEISPRR
ncbi:hypothetical protein [Rathayibacter sp. AY1F6]|uniref:hypothetical protein n=1 Tax=Rathayibacter sp. AY1F6 TaxID=2080560 RepID=UPI0015E48F08|nr:hypothetical protein [Rathayibacter sp. AY1F6]